MIKFFGGFTLLISIIVFASCTKPDIQWGQQLLAVNSNLQLTMIDTFKPKISTVYIDSFATSNSGILVVGAYTDPAFGRVNSQSFLELAPPTVAKNTSGTGYTNPYQNTIYDSIRLILKLKKGSYYGDSTQLFHIDVNELAEQITLPINVTSLYNLDNFQVKPALLGSSDFRVFPNYTDSILMKLSDSLGLAWYAKLSNSNDVDLQTATTFLNYFNGLRISGSSSSMILNFSDSVIVRLYYREKGYILTDKTTDFVFTNAAHQFNNITINRTGSPIYGLGPTLKEIPSEQTNNTAYLQSATASMVKISFPSLYNIQQQLPNFSQLMSAKLIIRPILNSFSFYTLPPQLRLSVTNTAANNIGNDLTLTGSGSATPVVQYGSLYIDYLYGINTAYTYDITEYVKSQLATGAFYPGNHYGLLLSPPSGAFSTAFNRVLIANDQNDPVIKIELQIIYAAIQ